MNNIFENPVNKTKLIIDNDSNQQEIVKENSIDVVSRKRIPIIRLGENVQQETVDEVEHAALVTLKTLGINMEKFSISDPNGLVNTSEVNKDNLYTFSRLPGSDAQVPVVVVSSLPVYDSKKRELIALYEPDNAKVLLNLRKIKEAFSGSPNISEALMAGIVTVEEIVHFIQDKYWNRSFNQNTIDFQSEEFATEHDNNPIEAEANQFKKQVFDVLYPELQLRVRGIDF
jgi:hypothetical protein